MPNYKQTNVIGTSWVRANNVTINNPLNNIPEIIYHENEAINVNGNTIQTICGSISQAMVDENVSFPLVNSEDWSQPMNDEYKAAMIAAISSGNVPIWVIYQLLNSHYASLANSRDNQ